MRVVIIGNGPAGFSAAKRLKQLSPDTSVAIFDRGDFPFYTKIRLPEFIGGRVDEEKLILAKPEEYQRLGIELHRSTIVERVDLPNKQVHANGTAYPYDKLILALGAQGRRPEVPGMDLPGVFTLHSIEEARELRRKVETSTSVVVIGGGLLGLEIAGDFLHRGLRVDIVEFFPRLMPKQLDEVEAAILQEELESRGFTFHLDRSTQEIAADHGALRVRTDKGDDLRADLVLVSAGIVSEVALAKDAGVKTNRAIVVDDRFATSAADVHAVGDCSELKGVVYGLWSAAKEQGEALAEILLGQKDAYVPSVFEPALKASGIKMADIRAKAQARRPN